MKGKFWRKALAAALALLIVSGSTPIQPLSQVFEDIAITASAIREYNYFLVINSNPGNPTELNEGETVLELHEGDCFEIYNRDGDGWGGFGPNLNVPFTGEVRTFGIGGIGFNIPQDGKYVFTLTDKGEGNWFVSVLYSLENCTVSDIPAQTYTGSAITPEITVTDGEKTLTLGTDYEVTYSDNTNAGTAKATITGKGNYGGTIEKTFSIVRNIYFSDSIENGSVTADRYLANEGDTVTLTVTPDEGYAVKSVKYNDTVIEPVEGVYSFTMPDEDVTVSAEFEQIPVTYLDENGVEQTITDYTVLTGDEAANSDSIIELSGGTYVVNSDINYSGDAIYSIRFTSDTTLILCDGKTMKVKLNQTSNGYGITCGGNLTICGQSGGTGKLDVYAYSVPIDANNITINGGNISAQSVYYSAISSDDSVMLNGGTVNATGGQFGTYYGVEARGGDIILGGAEVTANSYSLYGGTVQVKEGLIYGDEDGNIYDSSNNLDTAAIAGKTLAPVKPQSLSSGTIASQPVLHIGNSDNILAVQNTYLDGYEFGGFDVNGTTYNSISDVVSAVREIRNGNHDADITITPVFTQKEQKYDLTIVGGHLRDQTGTQFKASDQLYAVADEAQAGEKFSHWEVDGKLVGYDETYAFRMPSKDMTLTAVYVADTVEVKKEGVGYIENVYKPADGKMSFVSILSIPDGCQMLKAGIVAQKSEVLGTDELTENNARFVRYSDTSANTYSSFKYTWTLTASDDSEWTVRPYLVYTDAQGEHTVYGAAETNKLSDFE